MLSPKRLLVALALVLCAGNVYVTFARSTIPLSLDGIARPVKIQAEDRPGIDDVFLLPIGSREYHVDQSVAERVIVGQRLRKEAWSSQVKSGETTFEVEPSRDFEGMVWVMPILFVALVLLLVGRRSDPAP